MGFWDKAEKFVAKASQHLEKEGQRMEGTFKSNLRGMSDQQIRNALINIDEENWKYRLVKAEACRRGL